MVILNLSWRILSEPPSKTSSGTEQNSVAKDFAILSVKAIQSVLKNPHSMVLYRVSYTENKFSSDDTQYKGEVWYAIYVEFAATNSYGGLNEQSVQFIYQTGGSREKTECPQLNLLAAGGGFDKIKGTAPRDAIDLDLETMKSTIGID